MIAKDLSYNNPNAVFFIFAIVLFLILLGLLFNFRRLIFRRFGSKEIIKTIFNPPSAVNYWAKALLLCFVWIFATMALMEPKGNARYIKGATPQKEQKNENFKLKRKAHEITFLLDDSASMMVKDARAGKTRLQQAKEIIDELVGQLRGESAAVYAFTSATDKLVPQTMDYIYLRLMLRDVSINEGNIAGTDISEALKSVMDDFNQEPKEKFKTLIILSDGGDTSLEEVSKEVYEQQAKRITDLLGKPEDINLRVLTVGIGSLKGGDVPNVLYKAKPVHSSLQEDILVRISKAGGGKYYHADNYSIVDLTESLKKDLIRDNAFQSEYESQMSLGNQTEQNLIYDYYFQYPLAVAILLLTILLLYPQGGKRGERE